jgi:hypothetical protein
MYGHHSGQNRSIRNACKHATRVINAHWSFQHHNSCAISQSAHVACDVWLADLAANSVPKVHQKRCTDRAEKHVQQCQRNGVMKASVGQQVLVEENDGG